MTERRLQVPGGGTGFCPQEHPYGVWQVTEQWSLAGAHGAISDPHPTTATAEGCPCGLRT